MLPAPIVDPGVSQALAVAVVEAAEAGPGLATGAQIDVAQYVVGSAQEEKEEEQKQLIHDDDGVGGRRRRRRKRGWLTFEADRAA